MQATYNGGRRIIKFSQHSLPNYLKNNYFFNVSYLIK